MHAVLETVVAPLMVEIGRLWHADELRPAHEHLATVTARRFVEGLPGRARRAGWAPPLLVAAPAGQLHELGASVVAASAEADGWRVVSLGVDVPAEDLALAVGATDARALSLSITHALDDPRLAGEFGRLRGLVGPDLPIRVGGQGHSAYAGALERVAAVPLASLAELRLELGRIRERLPQSEERP